MVAKAVDVHGMMTPKLGTLYVIAQNGRTLPNLYRYEGDRPWHCQMHGDYIGQQWLFRKRRNSDVRPWSRGICAFDPAGIEIKEASYSDGAVK